jgi:hypothetical protein
LGRFGEAIAFARQATAARISLAALSLLALSMTLNNAGGRRCFHALRSVWRSRITWPQRSGRLRGLPSHAAIKLPYVGGRH